MKTLYAALISMLAITACIVAVYTLASTKPAVNPAPMVIWRDQFALIRELYKGNGLVIGGSYVVDAPICLKDVTLKDVNIYAGLGCLNFQGASSVDGVWIASDTPYFRIGWGASWNQGVSPCTEHGGLLTFWDYLGTPIPEFSLSYSADPEKIYEPSKD